MKVQKAKQNYFKDRSIYYSTFPIQEQAKKSDWDFKLSHVYTVGILDFVFQDSNNEGKVVTEVRLTDKNCNVFYDKLTFIYLEMPNFNKREEELNSNFDKWLYVFKHLPDLQGRPRQLQERIFERFFRQAEIANFSPEERESYKESLKYYRDIKNVVDTSFMEGEKKGKEIGKEMGEKKKAYDIAEKLLETNLTIENISKITGLSMEEIKTLKSNYL